MKKEFEAALAEITSQPPPTTACWAQSLPDNALEFLQTLEEVAEQGKRVRRQTAADKFNELFPELESAIGRPISEGMIGNHMLKHCTCSQVREYGWPPNEK